MTRPGSVQVWAGLEPSAVSAALTALASVYTVALSRPVTRRRIWLDTADSRLYRNGMALTATVVAAGDGYVLELSSADGTTVTAGPDRLGWPRLLAGLPDPVRPRLEPVLGVRALLPVVRASGTAVTGRVLDAEDKTVLRLLHERPATISGRGGQLPDRLWLTPVRGYDAVGARAARILHDAGLVPDDHCGYRVALRAAGVDPDARPPAVLQPDLPAAVAVARVLLSFLGEMEAGLDGTVADVDIEFLHDFRVAVRRSRSTVKLLGDVLPPALVAWVTPQLAWLGELTSPSRDLDVQLQELPALSARLTAARPEDLEPLALHLTGLRTDERRVLVRGLRSARFERWRTRWRSALEELATVDDRPCAGPTAAELGVQRLAAVGRRVLRRGSRITAASPAEDLHNLRKRCKELRYLLEICTPLLAPGAARGAVAELKTLQDVLGTFQDSEAHREAIYAVAADMMTRGAASSRTILAMGEIAARLQEDQDSARAQYADRFQRFARRSVQRRIARLRQPAAAAAAGSSGGSR